MFAVFAACLAVPTDLEVLENRVRSTEVFSIWMMVIACACAFLVGTAVATLQRSLQHSLFHFEVLQGELAH